jgi:hypothetical protein
MAFRSSHRLNNLLILVVLRPHLIPKGVDSRASLWNKSIRSLRTPRGAVYLLVEVLLRERAPTEHSTSVAQLSQRRDSCIADFIQQMRRIEEEQIEVPTAQAHSVSGSSGHRVDPYDTNVEKKASSLSIDLPSFGKAIRMGDTVVDFVLECVELLHDFYSEHQDTESLVFCKKLRAVVAPNK